MRNLVYQARAFAGGSVLLLLMFLPGTSVAQGSSTRYVNPPSLVKPTGYTHL